MTKSKKLSLVLEFATKTARLLFWVIRLVNELLSTGINYMHRIVIYA